MKKLLLVSLIFITSLVGAHNDDHHGDDDVIGKPGDANNVTRTIKISMNDAMRFAPENISAKRGETIRFVVTNDGKLVHEFMLGTEKELKEHEEMMKKNPQMIHNDPNKVTLASGSTGEIVWQFTHVGKVDFACLQPGHYDAGMKGKIVVVANKLSGKKPAL